MKPLKPQEKLAWSSVKQKWHLFRLAFDPGYPMLHEISIKPSYEMTVREKYTTASKVKIVPYEK